MEFSPVHFSATEFPQTYAGEAEDSNCDDNGAYSGNYVLRLDKCDLRQLLAHALCQTNT